MWPRDDDVTFRNAHLPASFSTPKTAHIIEWPTLLDFTSREVYLNIFNTRKNCADDAMLC